MRLAFVHGINNEGETPESIERTWWDALVRRVLGHPSALRPDERAGLKILAE